MKYEPQHTTAEPGATDRSTDTVQTEPETTDGDERPDTVEQRVEDRNCRGSLLLPRIDEQHSVVGIVLDASEYREEPLERIADRVFPADRARLQSLIELGRDADADSSSGPHTTTVRFRQDSGSFDVHKIELLQQESPRAPPVVIIRPHALSASHNASQHLIRELLDAETYTAAAEAAAEALIGGPGCVSTTVGQIKHTTSGIKIHPIVTLGAGDLDHSADSFDCAAVRAMLRSYDLDRERASTSVSPDAENENGVWFADVSDSTTRMLIPIESNGVFLGGIALTVEGVVTEFHRRQLDDCGQGLAHRFTAYLHSSSATNEPVHEYRFGLTGGHILCDLADTLPSDQSLVMTEVRPSQETGVVYSVVGDLPDGLSQHPQVDVLDVGRCDDGEHLRFRLEPTGIGDSLEPVSGVITDMRLTDAGVQTTFEAPAMVPPRVVGQHLTDRWPEARLSVSWHSAPTGPQERLSDVLTDKQLEALRTALRMGFFDRPQRATANDVADLLDVSRSTFLHHLRGAEATLLGRIL